MPTPDNWISGTLPKRGATARAKPMAHGAKLTHRVLRQHNRNLAGRPLSAILDARAEPANQARSARLAIGIVAVALGLGGGMIGLAQGRLTYLLPGLLLIGGGVFTLWRGRGVKGQSDFHAEAGVEAARLDAYLDEVLPHLPQDAVTALSNFKELLADVVLRIGDPGCPRIIPIEEQFFVRELMARYLRDACNGYIAVVVATRSVPLPADARKPEDSLLAQIDVMSERLRKILTLSAASELDKMSRHEAFIASKR